MKQLFKRYYIDRIIHWTNKAIDRMLEDEAKEQECNTDEVVPGWDDARGTLYSDLLTTLDRLEEFRNL